MARDALATGELAARIIADRLYPGKAISEMTESEKQTVTTLSLLAGGLAAGTVGDSTTNAVAGAQASQNVVENNFFGPNGMPKGLQDYGQSVMSWTLYVGKIKDPTNAVAGAGAGTIGGGLGGTITKDVTSKVAEEAVSDLAGVIGGSYISEETGNFVKGHLDKKGKNENKN